MKKIIEDDIRLSIIIPVYNVKDYLSECINSILCQVDDFTELILIDDGSNDGTEKICDCYAAKFENVITIHQENQGVSIARNIGINHSNGKWVCFVDADDLVTEDFYEQFKMYENLEEEIILLEMQAVNSESHRKKNTFSKHLYVSIGELIKDAFLYGFLEKNRNISLRSVCAKFFKKDFLVRNELKCPEGIAMGEDMLFMLAVYSCCKEIKCITKSNYIYRYNEKSATHIYRPEYITYVKSFQYAIKDWLDRNPEYKKYHATARLNDIIFLMKLDWFHEQNKTDNCKNRKKVLLDIWEGGYDEYYRLAQKEGLLKYYGWDKRIVFFAAIHKWYYFLKLANQIRNILGNRA